MSNTHKQTLRLSRTNLILVWAQPVRDGWSLTLWRISFLPSCPPLLRTPSESGGLTIRQLSITQTNQSRSLVGWSSLLQFYFLLPEELNQALLFPLLACSSVLLLINLGAGLLFWRGCIKRSCCFMKDCYCTWNNTRMEVRWGETRGAECDTPKDEN